MQHLSNFGYWVKIHLYEMLTRRNLRNHFLSIQWIFDSCIYKLRDASLLAVKKLLCKCMVWGKWTLYCKVRWNRFSKRWSWVIKSMSKKSTNFLCKNNQLFTFWQSSKTFFRCVLIYHKEPFSNCNLTFYENKRATDEIYLKWPKINFRKKITKVYLKPNLTDLELS